MKILAVIVRYQTPLSESPAVQEVTTALLSEPNVAQAYTVLIWDNSPDAIPNPQLSTHFLYRHSKKNLGVSGAYNGAMDYALEHGYQWMLLLDQDTRLTPAFLSIMLQHSEEQFPRTDIAAITPTVRYQGVAISPSRCGLLANRPYPEGTKGIAPGEAAAINSGSLMRVAALQAIGGFSPDFWLDYSDLYVFRQFYLHGMKVWLAGDAELAHDMAMLDYDRLMTPWRCRNLCSAETVFNDLYHGPLENCLLTFRLFLRTIKHGLKYNNPEFSRIAWSQLVYRLRVPKAQRIAQWFAEKEKRNPDQTDGPGEIAR